MQKNSSPKSHRFFEHQLSPVIEFSVFRSRGVVALCWNLVLARGNGDAEGGPVQHNRNNKICKF